MKRNDEFAKVFGKGRGQIVVMLDEGQEGPEIRAFTRPPNLGVCSLAIGYSNDDAGWDRAEAEFAKVDEKRAKEMVAPLIRQGLSQR